MAVVDELFQLFGQSIFAKVAALRSLDLTRNQRKRLRSSITAEIRTCGGLLYPEVLAPEVSEAALQEAERLGVDIRVHTWQSQSRFDKGRTVFHWEHVDPISCIQEACERATSEEAVSEALERIRATLDAERSTESFAKRKETDAKRREKAQGAYVEDFFGAVVTFLAFHPNYADLACRMARAVTDHATLVGSGTVARTRRIPIEGRAEAAVIAWMRHQTTGYDGMVIPRIKGKRREVRRMLARRSHELLEGYRRGGSVPDECPLKKALGSLGNGSKFSAGAP